MDKTVPDVFKEKITFAPLYTDHRSGTNGRLYYRETFDPTDLADINAAINNPEFKCDHAFIATWVNVADFVISNYAKQLKNTFQLVLASNGKVTYGLAYYYRTDSAGWAISGWSDRVCDKIHTFPIPTNSELTATRHQANRKVFLLTEDRCVDL